MTCGLFCASKVLVLVERWCNVEKYILFIVALMANFGCAIAGQSACEMAISKRQEGGEFKLPAVCAKFGPISLGMTELEVKDKLGAPDAFQTRPGSYTQAWYVYPRDFASQLKAKPAHPSQLRFGYLSILYRKNVVASIESTNGSNIGFGHEAFRLYRRLPELEKMLRLKSTKNPSNDYARIIDVPVSLTLDSSSGEILDVSIAIDDGALYSSGGLTMQALQNAEGLVDSFTLVTHPLPNY